MVSRQPFLIDGFFYFMRMLAIYNAYTKNEKPPVPLLSTNTFNDLFSPISTSFWEKHPLKSYLYSRGIIMTEERRLNLELKNSTPTRAKTHKR